MQRGRVLVAVVMAGWLGAQPAWAEDAATRAAARQLAENGVTALQAGDTATAVSKLEKAFSMLQVPSIALWSARALVQQGKLVEAGERLVQCTRLPVSGDTAVQQQARTDAQSELDQLRPRIPNLKIEIDGVDLDTVQVTLDGREVPRALLDEEQPVNPGSHHVVASSGSDRREQDVQLAEREHRSIKLHLKPGAPGAAAAPATSAAPASSAAPSEATPSSATASAPAAATQSQPAPSSTGRTLGYVALAAGGAGLVFGGITGALALKKHSDLVADSEHCNQSQCVYAVEDRVSSMRTMRTLSTIGFVGGGVLAAAGITLLLTAPSSQQSGATGPELRVAIGPGSLHLQGAY